LLIHIVLVIETNEHYRAVPSSWLPFVYYRCFSSTHHSQHDGENLQGTRKKQLAPFLIS